jgi:hypothetical protein
MSAPLLVLPEQDSNCELAALLLGYSPVPTVASS